MSFSLLDHWPPPPRPSWLKRHPVLAPLLAFVALLLTLSGLQQLGQSGQIGLLQVQGVILNAEDLLEKISHLEQNAQVKGVLLRIDSPGGGAGAAQEVYQALLRLKKTKPLYASIGSLGASGGYYLALAAERIYASPASLTGSIGVLLQQVNVEDLMGRLGVRVELLKAGQNKDVGSSFRPMSKEERNLLESILQDTHEQFIQALAQGRNLPLDQARQLADGRLYTGRQAQQKGLVDQLAGFDQALTDLKKQVGLEPTAKLYRPPDPRQDWLELMATSSFSQIGQLLSQHLPQGGLFYLSPLASSGSNMRATSP